jgi:hypothetical protein
MTHIVTFAQRVAVYRDRVIPKLTSPNANGCIEPPLRRCCGYARIRHQSKRSGDRRWLLCHRIAWEHSKGPIPRGMFVCHTCDNRACCNVDHLFLGTLQDNVADMVRKGRQARGEALSTTQRGSHKDDQRHYTKVDWAMVRSMRRDWAERSMPRKQIASKYGITTSNLWLIANNKTWRETVHSIAASTVPLAPATKR